MQIKNIKHPHDAHLMSKLRDNIVKLCNDFDISLNETYAKKYKFLILQLWKYKKDSKAKKRFKTLKHLKTLLGRLIRKFEREVESRKLVLQIHHKEQLKTIKSIYAQSALNGFAKKEYKKQIEFCIVFMPQKLNVLVKVNYINHMNLVIK